VRRCRASRLGRGVVAYELVRPDDALANITEAQAEKLLALIMDSEEPRDRVWISEDPLTS
jgi:hypothetical protein